MYLFLLKDYGKQPRHTFVEVGPAVAKILLSSGSAIEPVPGRTHNVHVEGGYYVLCGRSAEFHKDEVVATKPIKEQVEEPTEELAEEPDEHDVEDGASEEQNVEFTKKKRGRKPKNQFNDNDNDNNKK